MRNTHTERSLRRATWRWSARSTRRETSVPATPLTPSVATCACHGVSNRWLAARLLRGQDGTIGGLRQALESLQAEHSATSAKLAQLQMSTTLQDLEEAEATVKEMEGEIRDLKAENEELHRRLEELSSRVGANHRKMKVGRVQAAAPCASAATRCNRRLPLRRRPPYVLPGGAHAQPAEDQ